MFKVIEAFSGIGSQAKALERLDCDYQIVNTVEWDINAILAYCIIHKKGINISPFDSVSDEDILKELEKYSLSCDGKKPCELRALLCLSKENRRLLYAAIKNTNNLVSITDVNGKDIPSDIDLFTYSFPCQDLSLGGCWHGNNSGISRNVHNRSGMLWEVERILLEMNESDIKLPKFLLMENVANILSKTHENDFNEWISTLNNLGYYNKIYKLNAKNFGIPQKRERAYMISVLCDDDNKRNKIEEYFDKNDLQNNKKNNVSRNLKLEDILKLNYSNKKYKQEADLSVPNKTPSRDEIFKNNCLLYDGKDVKNIVVPTVTTKQDRHPNSGVIMYNNNFENKENWRYLTPRECFMLMGFDEEDYEMLSSSKIINRKKDFFTVSKLLKLAGNSIVVDVLEAIFYQILEINKLYFKE